MNRNWKAEHVNRNGITSRAIVNGIAAADAKRRPAEIGLKAALGSRFLSIVLVQDAQAHAAALNECRQRGCSVTCLDNTFAVNTEKAFFAEEVTR